jgi:phosphohistidine phosphatase SixA
LLILTYAAFVVESIKENASNCRDCCKDVKKKKKMEDWNELKPEGNKQDLYHKLSSSTQFKQYSSILVVGYEPYLTDMISDILSVTLLL